MLMKLVPSAVAAADVPLPATQSSPYQTRTATVLGANHQELVTAVHLALGKDWFVGRDELVSVGRVKPMRVQPSEAGVWT
jgi:hypothetical protein